MAWPLVGNFKLFQLKMVLKAAGFEATGFEAV